MSYDIKDKPATMSKKTFEKAMRYDVKIGVFRLAARVSQHLNRQKKELEEIDRKLNVLLAIHGHEETKPKVNKVSKKVIRVEANLPTLNLDLKQIRLAQEYNEMDHSVKTEEKTELKDETPISRTLFCTLLDDVSGLKKVIKTLKEKECCHGVK